MGNEGKCCPAALIKNQCSDVHLCTICYDAMTDPVRVNCKAGHVFGRACIDQWMTIKEQNTCPMCRHEVNKVQHCPELKKEVNDFTIGCKYCSWHGKVSKFENHRQYCQQKETYFLKKLAQCVQTQKQFLGMGFFQHYKEKHTKLFEKHCTESELKDLETNARQWNWWWHTNPVWHEQCAKCEKCQELENKYGKQIYAIDRKRKNTIENINEQFVIEHLREIL